MASSSGDGGRGTEGGSNPTRRGRGRYYYSQTSRKSEQYDEALTARWNRPQVSETRENTSFDERNVGDITSHPRPKTRGAQNEVRKSNSASHSHLRNRHENQNYYSHPSTPRDYSSAAETNYSENYAQTAPPKGNGSKSSRRPPNKSRFQRGHSDYQQYSTPSEPHQFSNYNSGPSGMNRSQPENVQYAGQEHLNSYLPPRLAKSRGYPQENPNPQHPQTSRNPHTRHHVNGAHYVNSTYYEPSNPSYTFENQFPEAASTSRLQQYNRVESPSYAFQPYRELSSRGYNGTFSRDKYGRGGATDTSSSSQSSSYKSGSRAKQKDQEYQKWRPEMFQRTVAESEKKVEQVADHATQRERLTSQLTSGVYECMVCCETVKPVQSIWNCTQCYHVFHLGCVRRWARSSQDESGQWRCPGCQSTNKEPAATYYCFCSKRKDPEWNRRDIPHSCGEMCGKALGDGIECVHNCTLLCHPGPCPSCSAQTNRKCPCGKTSQMVKCGSADALLCGNPCDRMLHCGIHSCSKTCHTGPCDPCDVTIEQTCFCGCNRRQVSCSMDVLETDRFACGEPCQKKLDCGRHACDQPCHAGPCGVCQLQVDRVVSCPCGKMSLKELYATKLKTAARRENCTDPVPVCGQTCGRILSCGPEEKRHACPVSCHEGPCPPCKLSTVLKCRCGRTDKKIPCRNLGSTAEVLCERRCNKKRQCGRHKCIQPCCVDAEHICPLVCGRPLSCGLDRCEALCHTGNCSRCYRVSFDELRCHCGSQVMYPPIPCGTRPPDCNQSCSRPRPCGHQPLHNCHPEASCPPCTVLCEKPCYGGHEVRKNVPCHLTEVSCGKPCGKALKCGRHTCPVTCHDGLCPASCTQPCPVLRTECSHPCNVACHDGACPGTPCKEKVKVQCQCGQRLATVPCEEQQYAYKKMATGLLASKMAALQSGETVDFKDLLGPSGAGNKNKSLECNEECALVERNRRLALALQIKNPNPKPGAPRYPELLKEWVKKDPRFAQMVHDKISELVQLAKQSVGKMKSRSYSFDPMNRDKRQFIHEYCAFFGCESVSYDEEPKRNVVVTAYGETAFLPAVGVLDVTRREMGQRKMPAPPSIKGGTASSSVAAAPAASVQQPQPPPVVWGKTPSGSFRTLSDVVKSTPVPANMPEPAAGKQTEVKPPQPPPVVDYFDFTS